MNSLEEKWKKIDKEIKQLIDTVIKGKLNLFVLVSRPGLSKSWIIEKSFESFGKSFKQISGHCTPLELYKELYHNRDGIVFIDDTQALLENGTSRSILMSAVWAATSNEHGVSYSSSTGKLDGIPKNFPFKGKIIICANSIPRKCDALKSRGYYYDFNMCRDLVISKMYYIAKELNIPLGIVKYIELITTKANIDLNFRDLIKSFELYKLHKNWQVLVQEQVKADEDNVILLKCVQTYDTVCEQRSNFCRLTDLSQRTFSRRKKKMGIK